MNSSRRGLAHGFKLESLGKVRQYLRLNCLLKPVLGLSPRMLLSNSMYRLDVMVSDCTNGTNNLFNSMEISWKTVHNSNFYNPFDSQRRVGESKNKTSLIMFWTYSREK